MLQQAGFTEVAEQVIRLPFNDWVPDEYEKEIGKYYLMGLYDWVETLTLGPFSRVLRWDRPRIDKLVADVRAEICTRRHHVYSEMHIWTGRRPA